MKGVGDRRWRYVLLTIWPVVTLLSLLSTGCGYSVVRPQAPVPDAISRLHVAAIEAGSGDPVFADRLRRGLRTLIRRQGRFTLTAGAEEAEVILRVDLDEPFTRPVSFDEYDEVLDYETTVVANVRLEGRDGEELWGAERISSTRGHAAVSAAVVTSSAQFVGGGSALASDLEEMDAVQLGEARRAVASETLVDDLARAIHARLMGGF